MIDTSIGHGADRARLDAITHGLVDAPQDTRVKDAPHAHEQAWLPLTIVKAIELQQLPVSKQQLSHEDYGLNQPPITATIEGDN